MRLGSLLLPLLLVAPLSLARPHLRFGGAVVSAGYTGGGYSPWFYDPFLFYPVYAPGFYTGFASGPNMGAVKIEGRYKDALVYLDGALAGRADKLKQMWLNPGTYELELRSGDRRATQKIYVLSGKTLKVTPELMEVRP